MIKNKLVLDINKKVIQTHIPKNSRYKNRGGFSNKSTFRFQTMNKKGHWQKMTIIQKINRYVVKTAFKVNLLLTHYINESIGLNTK